MPRVFSSGEKIGIATTQPSEKYQPQFEVLDTVARSAQDTRRKARQSPKIGNSLTLKCGDSL